MTKEQKLQEVAELTEKFNNCKNFYITDASTLTVETINKFREECFKNDIEYRVAKNTLIKKALEQAEGDYEGVYEVLKGHSSIMFAEVANVPARALKDFREKNDKPVLKAAYIDSDVFIGDGELEALSKLKSKEELVGEIIGLLQSPAKNVISALQSSGQTLSGLLKTLSEREG